MIEETCPCFKCVIHVTSWFWEKNPVLPISKFPSPLYHPGIPQCYNIYLSTQFQIFSSKSGCGRLPEVASNQAPVSWKCKGAYIKEL